MRKILFVSLPLISLSLIIAYNGGMHAKERAKYVGVKKCKMCHLKQYKVWKESLHANAFERLKGKEVRNPVCLKCHTTGFGRGGFKNITETPHLAGIGCEACHGAGSLHIKAKKAKRKLTIARTLENVCIECHNPHVRNPAKHYGEKNK
jgi:nitrate/TMAO reductase-like tetraheme cytochrome c subunit